MLLEKKKTRTPDVHSILPLRLRYASGWLIYSVLAISAVLISMSAALASGVHPLFDLSTPSGCPFPSDLFTVVDRANNTKLRVNLPLPDCLARSSDCRDLNVINSLDGFNVQPRLSIPFDGPIDLATITSESVFLISLGPKLPNDDDEEDHDGNRGNRDDSDEDHGGGNDGERAGRVIGLNQIVWDPLTNTLHAESDALLDQHTRYALIVTNRLRDSSGRPVNVSETFRRFRHEVRGDYKQALLHAIHAARRVGLRESDLVTVSVFTTLSATATLEKIRDQVKQAVPAAADFNLGSGGTRTVFSLDGVGSITFRQQTGDNPARFTSVPVGLSLLDTFSPGAVRQIAFGKYLSPDYEVHPGEFIPEIKTRTGTPIVQGENAIYFTLFVPSGPKPAQGWPVVIFGHGGTGNKDNDPYSFAASLATQGIATIAINFVGRGFGPLGTLTVNLNNGGTLSFPSGGRGFDQNGNGTIAADEGAAATSPREIIGQRDSIRQSVVDLMQLVREIEVGMDMDGDGSRDLDSSRMYYFGWSFGGGLGVEFLAIEPNVGIGVFNVPGAAAGRIDLLRLRPAARASIGAALASRTPSLINSPGLTSIGGISVGAPYFNENTPLRNKPAVINEVVGAIEIQQVFENAEWASESGDAAAYAPHLQRSPLPGAPVKAVMLQLAKGDQTGSNPRTSAIIRAGDLADLATFYRNDLAFAEDPTVPKDPHTFLSLFTRAGIAGHIARGGQMQVAIFLGSNGSDTVHPEPERFFEVPIVPPLPEDLNYIP